jgi:protein-tyrosine phosphatase
MIDLHAHLLPGVDDGPASWEEALELCWQLASQQVTAVVATPHFVPGCYPDAGQVLELTDELNSRLRSLSIGISVYPGAEAYLVPELPQLVAARQILTLNNAGRYLLVELPFEEVPACTENVFFSLMLEGIIPVLAHPERNSRLRETPSLLATMVERGSLVQVNAGSLLGEFGPKAQKFTGDLLLQGQVHFIGSDAHCPRKRPPLWPAAYSRLEKLAGREAALALTLNNPKALLAGDEIVTSLESGSLSGRGSNFWGRALAQLLGR